MLEGPEAGLVLMLALVLEGIGLGCSSDTAERPGLDPGLTPEPSPSPGIATGDSDTAERPGPGLGLMEGGLELVLRLGLVLGLVTGPRVVGGSELTLGRKGLELNTSGLRPVLALVLVLVVVTGGPELILGRKGLLLRRSGSGLGLGTLVLPLGRKGLELRGSGSGPGPGLVLVLVLRGPALVGCLFRRRVFNSSKAASRLTRSSLLIDDALS